VSVVIGYYYIQTGRRDMRPFFPWTVHARASVFVIVLLFVLLGWAPTTVVLFGTLDLLGAVWTFLALRAKGQGASG
jgi:hypothetical protein